MVTELTDFHVMEILKEVDPRIHAGIWCQAWMKIHLTRPDLSFPEIEKMLRTFSQRTYLVAMPQRCYGDEVTAYLPSSGYKKIYPYHLWVCVNGEQDMLTTLADIEISPKENLENLSNCGVSWISRASKQLEEILEQDAKSPQIPSNN